MIRIQNTVFFEDKNEYESRIKEFKGFKIKELGWFHDQHDKFKVHYNNILHNPKDYFIVLISIIKPEINHWFVSDLHLGQHNILKYDNRPFDTIEEHDKTILKNINSVVQPDDHLYILGDTFFYKKKDWYLAEDFLLQLKGKKFFIKGNHDYKETIELYKKYGTHLGEQRRVKIGGDHIVLNHFPMRSWLNSHHGTYHLYGHHHGDIEHTPYGRSMDVWIGNNNYYPLNWTKDIEPVLSRRNIMFLQGDHHTANSL